MTGYLGKATNEDKDVVGAAIQDALASQWGNMPGEVVDFNPQNQTATVKPLYKPIHDGEAVEMPNLYEVKIAQLRTASGAVTYPIKPGTKVMLHTMMRSQENYDENSDGTPSDRRINHLSDMWATLSGGESLSDPVPNYDNENTHIRFDPQGQYGMRGSEDGKFKLDGSEGNIYQLYNDAIDECQKVADKLKDEPALIFKPDYAAAASALAEILAKLRAMEL